MRGIRDEPSGTAFCGVLRPASSRRQVKYRARRRDQAHTAPHRKPLQRPSHSTAFDTPESRSNTIPHPLQEEARLGTTGDDRIITTQGDWTIPGRLPVVRWYSVSPDKISYLSEVKILVGVDTKLTPDAFILRISADGTRALITQDSMGGKGSLCDVRVADLTKDPPRILYDLDAGGGGQGIEFTPEGDKLFVGSSIANRIEVFDVIGDFELRKNPKFLKTGYGHGSLTLGPTYRE